MAKAVLISIRPEWVEKILAGEKTLEVRKTRPNMETPFKCYIYETQGRTETPWIDEDGHKIFKGRGLVIGEFLCDTILPIQVECSSPVALGAGIEIPGTCLTDRQILEYLGNGKRGFAWHISKLEIYDTPKELSKFLRPFENCIGKTCDEYGCAYCENGGHIKRPPQSWCHVEELE